MENNPLLLSVPETCQLIGVRRTLFYSLRNSGDFAPMPIKLGNRTLYRKCDVERWVALNCPHRKQWLEESE